MKNIVLLIAVTIFLVSCKKNKEGVGKIEENSIAGNWSAAYLNTSIQVNIDQEQIFSLSIPVIVKKESNAAPEVLNISLQGVCVREDAGYELRVDAFVATGIKGSGSNSLNEIKQLVNQSLEAAAVEIERSNGVEQKTSARLTAENGKLKITAI